MTFSDAVRAATQLIAATVRGGSNNQGAFAATQFRDALSVIIANEGISERRALTSAEVDSVGLELCVACVAGRTEAGSFTANTLKDAKAELRKFA